MKVRKTFGVVAAAVVAAGLLASLGCPPGNQGAKPLTIAYSDWPGWLVWEIANQKGFCKDAGVDVNFVWYDYLPSMKAFETGNVDAVLVVCGDSLTIAKPSTAIVLTDYSNGNDMIIGKPEFHSIKDLKGKKVAVEENLVEHILLAKALEKNGMTESDVTIESVATDKMPVTLGQSGIAAVGAWYPISGETLKQNPGSAPLFRSSDAPGLIYDALQVSRESLATRRDDWKKVVGVWFKCLDYLNDPKTHADAVKIMAARIKANPDDLEKNLKGTQLLDKDGNLKALEKRDTLDSVYGSLKNANAFYLSHKVYDKAPELDPYVDPSLVKEVIGKSAY
ncbi:MAG TPA: ABC transporter substrate-binding protein [Gemmataceae bacterium]|nr:ABC transporter substrate-binding protein [Gemmataceae bacterium]